MRFVVDAQLPRSLSRRLAALGHDALHTLDLPQGNTTSDEAINALSVTEKRIVVSKDADFVNSLILHGMPFKLLLVSTGNITNKNLEPLFFRNLDPIIEGFASYVFIEIDRTALRFHF